MGKWDIPTGQRILSSPNSLYQGRGSSRSSSKGGGYGNGTDGSDTKHAWKKIKDGDDPYSHPLTVTTDGEHISQGLDEREREEEV